jgi:hypothetical protein
LKSSGLSWSGESAAAFGRLLWPAAKNESGLFRFANLGGTKGSYMKKNVKITTKELEDRFDEGGDVLEFFDVNRARIEEPRTQRVNVDFPEWMVRRLDDEAARLGISRQAIIKFIVSRILSPREPWSRTYSPLSPQYEPRLSASEFAYNINLEEVTATLQLVQKLLREQSRLTSKYGATDPRVGEGSET